MAGSIEKAVDRAAGICKKGQRLLNPTSIISCWTTLQGAPRRNRGEKEGFGGPRGSDHPAVREASP